VRLYSASAQRQARGRSKTGRLAHVQLFIAAEVSSFGKVFECLYKIGPARASRARRVHTASIASLSLSQVSPTFESCLDRIERIPCYDAQAVSYDRRHKLHTAIALCIIHPSYISAGQVSQTWIYGVRWANTRLTVHGYLVPPVPAFLLLNKAPASFAHISRLMNLVYTTAT